MLIEKEVGNPIKVLRTDHGGEFNSHEFTNFCETHGIKGNLQLLTHLNKMVYARGKIVQL